MGKHSKRLLRFALAYPYSWHSYAKDRATVGAVTRLCRDGLLVRNEYGQFRLNVSKQCFSVVEGVYVVRGHGKVPVFTLDLDDGEKQNG